MPTLGVFVLFHTAPEKLERCLQSLQGVADEIVAVNFGAPDECRKIAERLATRVIDATWPDAFDEAYNIGLKQIESEWTLQMDSDEWLDEGSGEKIRKAIEDRNVFAYHLTRRDHYENAEPTEMVLLRLWRSHPSLKLVGVIHQHFPESLLRAAARGRRIANSGITFSHDGFYHGFTREKKLRNQPYIERELALRPGNPYFEIGLAETYFELGDPRAWAYGTALFDRLIQSGEWRQAAAFPVLVGFLLEYAPESELSSDRIAHCLRLATQVYTDTPGVTYLAGQCLYRMERWQESLECLSRLMRMRATGEYSRVTSFDARIFSLGLEVSVYDILLKSGDTEAAAKLKNVLAEQGHDLDALLAESTATPKG